MSDKNMTTLHVKQETEVKYISTVGREVKIKTKNLKTEMRA